MTMFGEFWFKLIETTSWQDVRQHAAAARMIKSVRGFMNIACDLIGHQKSESEIVRD